MPNPTAPNRAANLTLRPARVFLLLATGALVSPIFALALQNGSDQPVVVQPGAPGKPTRRLPASTHGKLPPLSRNDIEFMQGMIMHHAQAVEMTALIPSHTDNPELHTLGARISHSQSDEINFMKRWLAARGQPATVHPSKPESGSPGTPAHMAGMQHDHHADHSMLMPGMLTPEQMDALRKARGAQFDHLFLTGMIQHHGGALTMVKDLFDSSGSGQDAELFNFATDVDSGQRAEIRIMQAMLEQKAPQEKQ
ncbi:MAG TPA: DUF305 domain-containing protein [Candidatus Angelobacter sp.]|nr:DUF305 domain-containing protein [Candidatus Angelobacter sp.]